MSTTAQRDNSTKNKNTYFSFYLHCYFAISLEILAAEMQLQLLSNSHHNKKNIRKTTYKMKNMRFRFCVIDINITYFWIHLRFAVEKCGVQI